MSISICAHLCIQSRHSINGGRSGTGIMVVYSGVESCSTLRGTLHYQNTISIEKIKFLWNETNNGNTQAPCP